MSYIIMILCIIIVLTDMIRLSLMGWKATLLWSLVWMMVAYCSVMCVIRLSLEEIYEYLDMHNICLLGFIESFIFISYLFYVGKWKCILSYYPGLMMLFPVTILAFQMSRTVNGISFTAIGVITSVVTVTLLTGIALFLRWVRCEKSWLYVASVVSLTFYILIYGIS